AGRLDRPGGHLRFIGNEEIVEMPADELAASGLLNDNVDNVFAVEAAFVTEKLFFSVVVIFGSILEFPWKAPIRRARDLGLEGPARESSRALTHVFLGIVAGAEAEQLQEFAPPILVYRCSVVLLVVEPEDHRRIFRNLEQQVTVITHPVL